MNAHRGPPAPVRREGRQVNFLLSRKKKAGGNYKLTNTVTLPTPTLSGPPRTSR